ncbi:MAG TPA: phosphoribosyltransferase family protein [Syntrophales bacterium]|nr:phosphoribosyltransferase family protein [Syntrophales bacterium]
MGELRIISRSSQPFSDRREAGVLLGDELKNLELEKEDPIVVAILRGGIIVARKVALILNCDLDIALSRKLGAPFNPELAIGAISENGALFLNKMIAAQVGATDLFINREKTEQLKVIAERVNYFRRNFPKINLKGRYVIIVDDGIATGATMQATIWSIHQENPRRLMIALPVGPEDSLRRLTKDADEVICLRVPEYFAAVGQFYFKFEQTEDEEVLQILNEDEQRSRNEKRTIEKVG